MPQMLLPLFPDGVTHITPELAFIKKDGQITYFYGQMPVFVHDEADICTFRLITSQFCVNGNAKQVDIVQAFGVPSISVKSPRQAHRLSDAHLSPTYRPAPHQRLLQFVAPSFDAAAEELFPSLLSGAALVLHPDPSSLAPEALLGLCEAQGVTSARGQLVPAWLELMIVGGESLSGEEVRRWAHLARHRTRFVHAYGPTETTITATLYEAPLTPAPLRALAESGARWPTQRCMCSMRPCGCSRSGCAGRSTSAGMAWRGAI